MYRALVVLCLISLVAFGQSSQRSQGGFSHSSKHKPGLAFSVLPGGVPTALIATGVLNTAKGVPLTVTRATTKSCAGGTVAANRACVESKGLLVETSSADSVFGPSIKLAGTLSISGDITIKSFGAGYAYLVQVQNGGEDRFQLSVGPDGSGRCDYFDGSVRHADEFDSLVTANVKSHLTCTFDGSTLKVCVNGTDASHCATSAATGVTMGASYVPVLGSQLGSSNFTDGWIANICVDSTKCK